MKAHANATFNYKLDSKLILIGTATMMERRPEMIYSRCMAEERFNYAIYEIVDLQVKH